MRKLFRLLVIFSVVSIPFAGCDRGPEEAEKDEAMEGMEDLDSFDDVSETDDDKAP